MCMAVGSMFTPFMTNATSVVHISDVELLAIVLGIVVWVAFFKGTARGIAGNINALRWIATQRAQRGISLQILRAVLRWMVKHKVDFAGLYGRSHHNVSADHLARIDINEVQRWVGLNGFEWVSPYSVNISWANFLESVNLEEEWGYGDVDLMGKEERNANYGVALE